MSLVETRVEGGTDAAATAAQALERGGGVRALVLHALSATEAVLWVRADNGGDVANLAADVATDANFTNIVATLRGATSRDSDFTLKLQAAALTPHTRYFFRFRGPGGDTSPTGQFVTAPAPTSR